MSVQRDDDQHIPVLLDEVVKHLVHADSGTYLDGTFGRGGHARAILKKLSSTGRLLALDRDLEAQVSAQQLAATDSRFTFVRSAFADLGRVLAQLNVPSLQGVLLDLGVSSPQLDNPQRGFSFSDDGPLDMRMDTDAPVTAAQWLNSAQESDIANVIYQHGEERHSRRIARAIVQARPLHTTLELARVVEQVLPAPKRANQRAAKHPATRTFQALRIHINAEHEQLQAGLQAAFDALAVGGRLAVISFHSLEDRVVKQQFRRWASPPELPRRLPVRQAQAGPTAKLVGRAIRPQTSELTRNPRARSATLRVLEKVSGDGQ